MLAGAVSSRRLPSEPHSRHQRQPWFTLFLMAPSIHAGAWTECASAGGLRTGRPWIAAHLGYASRACAVLSRLQCRVTVGGEVAIERPDPALCGATHHFCSFLCSATSFVALADRDGCTMVRRARAYCSAYGRVHVAHPVSRPRAHPAGTGVRRQCAHARARSTVADVYRYN
jgi:hypothetical protein